MEVYLAFPLLKIKSSWVAQVVTREGDSVRATVIREVAWEKGLNRPEDVRNCERDNLEGLDDMCS